MSSFFRGVGEGGVGGEEGGFALGGKGGGEDEVDAWLIEHWRERLDGEMGRYLDLRRESVAQLLAEAYQAVHAVSDVPVHVQEASVVGGAAGHTPALDLAWHLGMEVPPREGVADGVSVLGYFAGVERFRREMDAYRARIPASVPLEVGLRPAAPDCVSAEELAAKVAHCASLGAAGISFYNYGMLPLPNMEWVRDALASIGAPN